MPKIARTIINHSDPDAPILAVEHLTDRLFSMGFRTLNPEYRTTQHELDVDAKKAEEYIKEHSDENDDHLGHFYQENRHLSKKEYAIKQQANGEDR